MSLRRDGKGAAVPAAWQQFGAASGGGRPGVSTVTRKFPPAIDESSPPRVIN